MPEKRTALILVGGEAKRSGGQEKYFFTYRGRSFLSYLIEAVSPVVGEIIVVARDSDQCSRFEDIPGIKTATDIINGIGPLGGIHAGINSATGDLLFITACDMPCIRSGVVDYLFSVIGEYDAAVPCWDRDMFEPLHAVYRKDALKKYIASPSSLSLRAMVRGINTHFVPVDDIRAIDPGLATFTNINDLSDLHSINGFD